MSDETSQLSDEQIDSLVESSEKPSNREIPMTDREASAASEPESPKVEEYEFDHGGKKYKATRDQLITWAKQGINYPQKMQTFNQERQKWDQDRQKWEKDWGNYRQVDEWAKGNPDKWQKLNQIWQGGKFSGEAPKPDAAPEFGEFKQKLLDELNQTLKPIFEERETAKMQKANDELAQEIKATRDKLSGIDFDSTNEDGKTIEKQILDFAIENKIPKFEVAAKAFLHDQILADAQARAKLDVSKGIQRDTKLGILGKEPIPKKKGFQPVTDVKNRSYEDLGREGLEELRAMQRA